MTMQADGEENAGEAAKICPLFMDELPSDFASDAALSALASLISEEGGGQKPEDSSKQPLRMSHNRSRLTLGGGKATKIRKIKPFAPYTKKIPQEKESKDATTTNELQLFMRMWKL